MNRSLDTVLVIGGCGFLGSHIVDALVVEGRFHVVAVSRDPTKFCNPEASYVACDILRHSKISAIIKQIQPVAIIHTVTAGSFAPRHLHVKDHESTKNLIEIATRAPSVKAFVYSSSSEAVKNASGARKTPLSETEAILHTPKTAKTGYAYAKSASDLLVLNAHSQALFTSVLRLPAVYGPRENKKTGIAYNFNSVANTPATRIQLGPNKVVHDWVYVENAAHAHVLAIQALLNPRQYHAGGGEAYFITDGAPIKLWDFVRLLWSAAGDRKSSREDFLRIVVPWWIMITLAVTTEFIFYLFTLGNFSPPLSRKHLSYMKEGAWLDISKAKRGLGYEPPVSTLEGISRSVEWIKQTYGSTRKADK